MNIIKDFITPNKYSRPQTKLSSVKGIVIHWVANPNTSAKANRNFFENRKHGNTGYGSAHFIVDLDGSILQCMPTNEVAYAVGSSTYTSEAKRRLGSYPNGTTISIETCHIDWEGHYTNVTYESMVWLTAKLLKDFGLSSNDIWTHQEVVGWKDCPRLFYKEPSRYKKFKEDVAKEMSGSRNTNTNIDTDTTTDISTSNTYTIKSGDTFYSIANKFNITVTKLKELNPNVDARALQIGETIIVNDSFQTHKVQAGDTLYSLSRKYNVSVQDIKQLNPDIDVTAIPIGTVLKIKAIDNQQVVKPTTPTTSTPSNDSTSKYPLPTGVYGMGTRGESVKQIQRALNAVNFRVDTVDGIYGSNTRNAVYRFQSMHKHLVNDGIYGDSTRKQLRAELDKN
jgi:N-acetylmuramoyl-L-alanine amidase CwlA